jgi:uncharacterized protein (TIGR03435 family)
MTLAFCWAGLAQADFEAASVKPAASNTPPGTTHPPRAILAGGPGSATPGSIFYRYVTLRDVVLKAHGLAAFQLNAPSWFDDPRFDIQAKVPANSTRSDLETMLQRLLAARFHLAVHREEKELPGYLLVVDAKGIKMKPAAGSPAPPDGGTAGKPAGPSMRLDFGGGQIIDYRVMAKMQSMADLASTLEKRVNIPIRDATGLTGVYDFELQFSVDDPNAAGNSPPPVLDSLPVAVRNQLGLRMDRSKVKVSMLVVDHAEKVPSEN